MGTTAWDFCRGVKRGYEENVSHSKTILQTVDVPYSPDSDGMETTGVHAEYHEWYA